MEYQISIYFLLFFIYSIAGWIMEVICKSIEAKKIINRGFMIGPYCPIYGCGAIIITILLHRYINDWIVLFFMSMITCGILEYLTSYVMEKLFHARWWDYTRRKYNINGRVCLETLVPFGIFGVIIMYITNPFILKYLNMLSENVLNIFAVIFSCIFVIDGIISLNIVTNVRNTSIRLNNEMINIKQDNTEEITAKVKEILRSKSILHRRLINAYPNLQTKLKKKKKEIKEKTEKMKKEIKDVATEYKQNHYNKK